LQANELFIADELFADFVRHLALQYVVWAHWTLQGEGIFAEHKCGPFYCSHWHCEKLSWCSLLTWSPFTGVLVGEAANPGPPEASHLGLSSDSRVRAFEALASLGVLERQEQNVSSAALGTPGLTSAPAPQDDDFGSCFGGTSHAGEIDNDAAVVDEVLAVDVDELPEGVFQGLLPGVRVLPAARDIATLARRIGLQAFGNAVPQCILEHQWSMLNCPLMWAAAGDSHSHPILEWLGQVLEAIALENRIGDERISASDLRTSWLALRSYLRRLGIDDRGSFLTWLRQQGDPCTDLGGHFRGSVQEQLIEGACSLDLRARDLSRAYVLAVMFLGRQPVLVDSILEHGASVPPGLPVESLTPARTTTIPPSTAPVSRSTHRSAAVPGVALLPDGWRHLESIELRSEILRPVRTLKAVPHCIRSSYSRIQTQVLARVHSTQAARKRTPHTDPASEEREMAHVAAWKLFLLLPRMLLFTTARGGSAGQRDLARRISLFDSGCWDALLAEGHTASRQTGTRSDPKPDAQLMKALALAQKGELSHAARELKSRGLAPGSAATLAELTDEGLRPPLLAEPLPQAAMTFQPLQPITLDKDVFATVLRQSRRGKSAGITGNRNEFVRICLEEDTSFNLLYDAAQQLANADVPREIVEALALSKLTALLKPNGRVRGIASGDVFRRLVTKTLARQKQETFRDAVAPANFGLCHRGGTDSLVHLVQFLLEEDPNRVVLSIDGVGAFDHVSRTRFFEELLTQEDLNDILPFVRQWYGDQSEYVWYNSEGIAHQIMQKKNGEQNNALIPALFCLALRRALAEVQSRLPPDCVVLAYHDDIYVICPHGDTRQCYDIVSEVLQQRCHIDVNIGKLKAWSPGLLDEPAHLSELGEEVWRGGSRPATEQGLKVVGTPLGRSEYIEEFGRQVIDDEAQLLQQLPKLASLQVSWLLLYFCAVPRINHLLRTVPPSLMHSTGQNHDRAIKSVFQVLFSLGDEETWNTQLHRVSAPTCMQQASLPLRLAGCGLRDSVRTSSAAYWASWADSLEVINARFPLVGRRIAVALASLPDNAPNVLLEAERAGQECDRCGWRERPTWAGLLAGQRPPTPEPDELSLGEWQHGWQYHASNAHEKFAFAQLLADLALPARRRNAQAPGKSRVLSACGRFAGAWLTTCPVTPAQTFRSDELLVLMRMRLGLAICVDGPDGHGYYRLADGTGGRTHARHKVVIAAWRQVFLEAGGEVPDRNVERLLRNTHVPTEDPHSLLRLDLVVPGLNVASGLPLFCDVTILSPLTHQGRARPGTSNNGGRLLARAEADNDATYDAVTRSGLGVVRCLGHEVFGRWCPQSVDLLPLLAREKARGMHPRLRRGVALAYQQRWAGVISVGLMKAVAAAAVRSEGSDLATSALEPEPAVADLLTF